MTAATGLRLVPLGVGEAFSAIHYTTSFALEAEGAWLLVDCPHPIRKMMREASATASVTLDIEHVSALVLTHLHADHSSGVEDFGYYSYFVARRKPKVVAHPDVLARFWDGHLAAGMDTIRLSPDGPPLARGVEDYFELIPADPAAGPVQVGPFSIECRPTIHAIPTSALRIRAGGRTLGFSADTAFDPTLIDWLAPADLIVHEVTQGEHNGLHTPYDRLAALPEALRAKIRLIHYPDTFDLSASLIEPLRQGLSYEV